MKDAIAMKKRKALVLSAIVAVSIGVTQAPVRAANYNGVCEATDVCLWKNADYLGPVFDRTNGDSNYTGDQYFNSAGAVNDETSSIWGRGSSTWRVRVYQNPGYSGNVACFDPNEITPSLPNSSFGNLSNDGALSHIWSTVAC
jgi:hypothetical protein